MSDNGDSKIYELKHIDRKSATKVGTIVSVTEHGVIFRVGGYRNQSKGREIFFRNEDILSIGEASTKQVATLERRESKENSKAVKKISTKKTKIEAAPLPTEEKPPKDIKPESDSESDVDRGKVDFNEDELNDDDDDLYDDDDGWED